MTFEYPLQKDLNIRISILAHYVQDTVSELAASAAVGSLLSGALFLFRPVARFESATKDEEQLIGEVEMSSY